MKGEFTRDTFDARNHFSQVFMQQGRVTLDADYNEQAAILLHYLRTLARDLIGPYAAPTEDAGFILSFDGKGIWIGAGRYYVDGILVENEDTCLYTAQPDYQLPPDDALAREMVDKKDGTFWLYLDVWERHITAIENDAIREKALGGADTCTRAKVMWQVKALNVSVALPEERDRLTKLLSQTPDAAVKQQIQSKIDAINKGIVAIKDVGSVTDLAICGLPLDLTVGLGNASLAARVDPGQKINDACVTPPDAKYRGAENQLYRVEIHNGGTATEATFKWSRDNGSVATAWVGTAGNDLLVANARGFSAGNWVELSDDVSELQGVPGILVKLAKVEAGTLSVDPSVPDPKTLVWSKLLVNPKVRRWDQIQTEDIVLKNGAVPVKETPANAPPNLVVWIDLEDGVQIQFSAGGEYRPGDYWLIPARVATGDIEWPSVQDGSSNVSAKPSPPRGVVHHYAPLGFVAWKDNNMTLKTCQCKFNPLSSCFKDGIIRGAPVLAGASNAGVAGTEARSVAPPKKPKRGGGSKKENP